MCAKKWPLFVLLLLVVPARAQESVRDLSGPGQYGKFLTLGQLDRWIFEGEKGETILAHVTSNEFDPTLELAKTGEKDDKVLLEVDDPGNESRFAFRLPEKGQYKIRIHADKYKGGGNYALRVQRFQAKPLAVGQPVIGTFDREGKSYLYFQGRKDQILVPDLKGSRSGAWKMLDYKGREMTDWIGTVLIEESGECYLTVFGQPNYRYDLLVREGRRQNISVGKNLASSLQPGELDVLSLQGKPGDFRVLEVEKKGDLLSRLQHAPLGKPSEQRIARPGDQPEIAFLPMASRGGRVRFAAILGREGRYDLQLLAQTTATYKLTARDPSVPIAWGEAVDAVLPVGDAAFYSFSGEPGQHLQARLASDQFVPLLRLYDQQGNLVAVSGDEADALEGRITHMVVSKGHYRLQISSLGDGGGGHYHLALEELKVKDLQIGGRDKGSVRPGVMDYWAFSGKEGQLVFLSVRSAAFEPTVSLRSPEGVHLLSDSTSNGGTGSLLGLKLPKTGRYTVWIASRRGAGEYTLRLIDGD